MSNNLSLNVTKNNALSDGTDFNTIEAVVLDDNQSPVGNARVLFSSSGSARFTNGSNILNILTDEQGSYIVNLVDSVAETVSITGRTLDDNQAVQTTFTAGYDKLELVSVSNINGLFPDNTFNIAWIGASFTITTTGGSGQLSWAITGGTGLAVTEESSHGAKFTFHSAQTGTVYTITGKDDITGEQVNFSFTLTAFITSWVKKTTGLQVILEGYISRLQDVDALLKIYQQWGDISTYFSSYDWFWSSAISYDSGTGDFSAQVVNITNGDTQTVTDVSYQAYIALFDSE